MVSTFRVFQTGLTRWSLRVAVVSIVIIVIVFAVAFVFLFVLVWLLSEENIGGYYTIRTA